MKDSPSPDHAIEDKGGGTKKTCMFTSQLTAFERDQFKQESKVCDTNVESSKGLKWKNHDVLNSWQTQTYLPLLRWNIIKCFTLRFFKEKILFEYTKLIDVSLPF